MTKEAKETVKKVFIGAVFILAIFAFGQIYIQQEEGYLKQTQFEGVRIIRESTQLHNLFVRLMPGIVYCYSGSSKTTGFFVSEDGWVITAGHKVDRDFPKANEIYVIFNRHEQMEALKSTDVIIANKLDLLAFKVKFKPRFYFKDFRNPHLFEECWIFGFRGVADIVPSGPGYVTYNTYKPAMFYLTARIYFGNSGSPVINRKGEVLGVAVEGYKNWDTNFIPGKVVKAFIESISKRDE